MKHVLAFLLIIITLAANAQLPYQNSSLTSTQRAEDLLQRLTLEEKVALMQNNSPAIPRLGIKPYEWWNEALHGVARSGLATVFPQAIGMAASFNNELLQKVFDAVSDEARAKNHIARNQNSYKRYQGLTFWTPNINIFRDPRWGRGQETYGEDPYLTSQMGMAVVRGLQGPENTKYNKAHACAKHYAVHSGPEWNRHSFNAENIAPRDLWETYLPAFKDLVEKAKVKEVMCAYNRFEGEPCCGSNRLLNQILREEWGFQGVVVSDCSAINDFYQKGHHETHKNTADASASAVRTGTDLECGNVYASLPEAVRNGQLKETDINRSLLRLLQARFELGEMDASTPWDTISPSVIDNKIHRQLALQMARQSIVLLQNKDNILPLKENMTIALIGPNANDSVMQWGNYNGFPSHTTTLLGELKQRLPNKNLIYKYACDRISDRQFISKLNFCSINGQKGFKATYWNNKQYEGLPIAKIQQDTPFQFNTDGATAFAANVPLTGFSAVYQTEYQPQTAGELAFKMMLRGEYELFINGKMVSSDKGIFRQSKEIYTLQAKAGKKYKIELKYRPLEKGATLYFDLGENNLVNIPSVVEGLKNADVVLFAGGIAPSLEGEEMMVDAPGFKGGDRTDIELPSVQREVISALKKAGKKIVFINFSGSAMGLVPESENCEAIIQTWYPGQAGGKALADVLFGNYNPAGRLPITFYKSISQLPDFQDYSMKGRTYRYMKETPLFSFGHGLSYTTFKYGDAQIEHETIAIPVTNIGNRNGEEVVQLYLQRPDDKNGPNKELRGFQRIFIPAGETCIVRLPLTHETFNWWDETTNTVHPLKGIFNLLYGGSSNDNQLRSLSYNNDKE